MGERCRDLSRVDRPLRVTAKPDDVTDATHTEQRVCAISGTACRDVRTTGLHLHVGQLARRLLPLGQKIGVLDQN